MRIQIKILTGFVVGMALIGPLAPQLSAQTTVQTQSDKPEQSRQFGTETGEIVLEAQDLMSREKYEEALNKLADVSSLDNLSPYEQSTIHQMEGACFYELDQYADSITAFENAVAAGGLLKNERRALEFNIAQLLIATDQFEKGAVMIENWHAQGGKLKHKQIEMLWQAWSQAGRYDKALPWTEKWFNGAGNSKTRQHFDALNFLYNNLGMPEKQMGIIEQMIEKWPEDKTLWDALASMMASNGREEEAFQVKLRQYDAGLLRDEKALLQLVQYHSFYGIPYQGAQLMEGELANRRISQTADHYSDLADLWRQAREYDRAIPVLKQAVSLSGKEAGPTLSKLAEAQYHLGQCENAKATIDKIDVFGSRNLSSLYTQLGVCYYEKSQQLPKANCDGKDAAPSRRADMQKLALNAFSASTKHKQGADKTVHKTALSWTNFILGEQTSGEEICEAFVIAERDRCFQQIDQAYSGKIFTNNLRIDKSCLKYKVEFDGIYRVPVSDQ